MKPDSDLFLTTTSTLSPPLILDSDMGEALQDSDLEFFNSALPHDSPSNGLTFEDALVTSSPSSRSLQHNQYLDSNLQSKRYQEPQHLAGIGEGSQVLSKQLSVSPGTSSQDSSSDSSRRYKRKTSSSSSQSAVATVDTIMTDEKGGNGWRPDDLMLGGDDPSYGLDNAGFPSLGGLSDPLSMETDYELSNKTMENHFDFDSAASSPSPFDAGILSASSSIGAVKNIDLSYQRTHRPGNKFGYNGRMLPVSLLATLLSCVVSTKHKLALTGSCVGSLRTRFPRSFTVVGDGHESGVIPLSAHESFPIFEF